MRRVFIVGGSVTPFIGKGHKDFITSKHPDHGKRTNPTLEDYLSTSVKDALADAGAAPELVDKIAVGNFVGELFSKQGHLGPAAVGALKGLQYKPAMRVEGACASGALAANVCFDAIRAGADVTLVAGVEVQSTVSPREGGDFLARASHYARQRAIDDFTFPALFGRRIKALVENKTLTLDDLNHFTLKAYANGNLNPKAHMQGVKMTPEALAKSPNFLSNEAFKPFLRASDCSQVTDGGCAIVLASEEGLAKLGKKKEDCVEIVSMAIAADNLYEDSDPTQMLTCAAAVRKAYELAGVTAADINVAEVHDCFNVAECLMYEALQFVPRGQGVSFIKDGHSTLEGKCPVNTGGGLLSFGHPVGATGVKQFYEVFRQMKGQCGAYQMKKVPAVGACLNMGGDDKTAVASILRNVA
eukprot:PhM_4_TR7049/c0_g1_i1/m.97891/K00626/E2.3.1.9, atoB; acetyl-CoA C-acetyltransferase